LLGERIPHLINIPRFSQTLISATATEEKKNSAKDENEIGKILKNSLKGQRDAEGHTEN
jgi:hypothetical protein